MDSERLREQALRSLLRMQEQSLATATTLRDPVDEVFKASDPQPHSYMVASMRPSRVIQPEAVLHVPPGLAKELRRTPSVIRPASASLLEDTSSTLQQSSMRSVRHTHTPAGRPSAHTHPSTACATAQLCIHPTHDPTRARGARCGGGTCPSMRG